MVERPDEPHEIDAFPKAFGGRPAAFTASMMHEE